MCKLDRKPNGSIDGGAGMLLATVNEKRRAARVQTTE
jgi:hypothetical protein